MPGSMDGTRPLLVTMGDPSGVGPDLILIAFRDRAALGLDPFVVCGDPGVFAERIRRLNMPFDVRAVSSLRAFRPDTPSLPVLDTGSAGPISPGLLSPSGATAAIRAIETAVSLVRGGEGSALVTAPIHKANMTLAGFAHPGHTEFLAALSRDAGITPHPVMMLATDDFRVVPVTVHIPLSQVPKRLTADLIIETAEITADALVRDYGIAAPRLAVSGLNPHAGEAGTLGKEDGAIIEPAVAALKARGMAVTGPLPADTMFSPAARATYDVALCMYHDQALIPIKTIAFDEAVNVTLGLPFVRTSPDHGTALDLAGTRKARPDSMIAALRMASAMARRRMLHTAPA